LSAGKIISEKRERIITHGKRRRYHHKDGERMGSDMQ
jgi:hypothetical protein